MERPKWGLIPYTLLHLVVLMVVPACAWAGRGQHLAVSYAWELIVIGAFVTAPIGAWLGATTPPPEGYEASIQQWSFGQQLIAGTTIGWIAAALAANYMNPINPLVVLASMMAAFGGAGLMILIRIKGLEKIKREADK